MNGGNINFQRNSEQFTDYKVKKLNEVNITTDTDTIIDLGEESVINNYNQNNEKNIFLTENKLTIKNLNIQADDLDINFYQINAGKVPNIILEKLENGSKKLESIFFNNTVKLTLQDDITNNIIPGANDINLELNIDTDNAEFNILNYQDNKDNFKFNKVTITNQNNNTQLSISEAHANEISFSRGNNRLGQDVFTNTGTLVFTNATFTPWEEDITISNKVELVDGNTIDLNDYNITIENQGKINANNDNASLTLKINGANPKKITVNEGCTLELSSLDQLTYHIVNDNDVENGTTITIIDGNGAITLPGENDISITTDRDGQGVELYALTDNKQGVVKQGAIDDAVIEEIIEDNNGITPEEAQQEIQPVLDFSQDIVNNNNEIREELIEIIEDSPSQEEGEKNVAELFVRLKEASIQSATLALNNVNTILVHDIHKRIDDISSFFIPAGGGFANNQPTINGVSSGDRTSQYGVWTNITGARAKQKQKQNIIPYHNDIVSLAVGYDTMLRNDLTVGAALSYTRSDVKYEGLKSNDSSGISSFSGAVYGIYNLTPNLTMNGSIFTNISKVKDKEIQIAVDENVITRREAVGKYTNKNTGLTLGADYFICYGGLTISPSIKASYSYTPSVKYNQTGDNLISREISRESYHSYSNDIGFKVGYHRQSSSGFDQMIGASLYGGFIHNTNTDSTVTIGEASTNNSISHSTKATFTPGIFFKTKNDNMDFGIKYEYHTQPQNKYERHLGSVYVKVRL
ncbi:MAG TPA: autotransporter domain-containing protein [Candidatus Megaira endosymbiont of Hartmannula sinica]|nr:autotransporter domain-containing protein [Candidatus Megaera endosymbiont of Hartmannula sinica]